MKLYGLVREDPDGYLFVSQWFFSPEDRENYIKKESDRRVELWGEEDALQYEKHYWFIEIDTNEVPYLSCYGDVVKELEEKREAMWLAEEEEEEEE